MTHRSFFAVLFVAASLSLAAQAKAQKQEKIEETFQGHIFRPAEEKPSDKLIAGLKVPSGFKISKFADELEKPRMSCD